MERDPSTEGDRTVLGVLDPDRQSALERLANVGSYEITGFDPATGAATLVRWSAECWRLIGLDPSDGPPPSYGGFVHPEDFPDVQAAVRRTLLTGTPGSSAHRVVRPDGEVRWLATRFDPVLTGGTPTGMVGVVMDVTDLQQARAERDRAQASLRTGFARSPIGFGVTDLEGRLVSVNPAYAAITGRAESELLGRRTRDLIHPDDVAGATAPRAALAAGEIEVFEAENRVVRPDGEIRWVHRVVTPAHEPGQEPFFLTQVEDVTERRAATERITQLARHDALTGLVNRDVLLARTTAALAGGPVTCVFLDVDRFNVVNDGLGHAAGDLLLVLLAQRLQATARPTDTLARVGGDEFVLVRPGDAEHLAEDVLATLAAPFPLSGRSVTVTVCAGVATSGPHTTAAGLLRDADAAVHRAKTLGRGQVVAHDPGLVVAVERRLDTESRLREALDRGELAVHHQPVVDVVSGRVVGTEALLRWQHPERGLIGPDEFIDVAEETGVVVPIGEFVLDAATADAVRWRREVPGAAELWVAVNVSARQLRDAGLVGAVRRALDRSGLPADAVHLEITESVLMDDADGTAAVLAELRATGVHLAVDDFGTGYSSLSYLTRLPVSTLKLDRSFVRGLTRPDRRDHAVVAAVVGLAVALGLRTVAEGVERPEQLTHLAALAVPLAQGFLWSPARPVPELSGWLRDNLAGR